MREHGLREQHDVKGGVDCDRDDGGIANPSAERQSREQDAQRSWENDECELQSIYDAPRPQLKKAARASPRLRTRQ